MAERGGQNVDLEFMLLSLTLWSAPKHTATKREREREGTRGGRNSKVEGRGEGERKRQRDNERETMRPTCKRSIAFKKKIKIA